MKTLISGAVVVNENERFQADIVIENNVISDILQHNTTSHSNYDNVIDAAGCFVMPGVIDTHVHFREPGLVAKADMESESRAAAYGGVTSFFDMPNTVPQTTTIEAFEEKCRIGAMKSHVNYSFFFGATNANAGLFNEIDKHRVPGIKLFMGASTGNMLVDRTETLHKIFSTAELPVVTHCEDSTIISANMATAKSEYGEDPDIRMHPIIRSSNACYESTKLALSLARQYGTRLHVAHLTTENELEFFGKYENITAEAVIAHLYFNDEDYERLGSLIKCNPAVKSFNDRKALRDALKDGRITTVGTDHAPHLLAEKQGGCSKAASGMPMIQFSLPTMLELTDDGIITFERLVELMCHNPARLFDIDRRGFIRKGYYADLTIVKPESDWTVTEEVIQSKCKWSPMLGHHYNWSVVHTFCNGYHIYNEGLFNADAIGSEISFRH